MCRLVAERDQAKLQRQQFKNGMAAAKEQMTELLGQHEARVAKNMKKMGVQIETWQNRLDAAEASLCVTQAALNTATAEQAKSLAQLAEEHTSELELVEASARASAAAAARFAQLRAEQQTESHAHAEAALRNQMAEQLQAHEQQCTNVAEATGAVIETMEAQLAHAVAAEGELEHSVEARLAEVEAERDTAMLFAEDVERARDEAVAALEQAHQDAFESMIDNSLISMEEESDLREELASQRAAISKGDTLIRNLAKQVEVLLHTLERQQAAPTTGEPDTAERKEEEYHATELDNPVARIETMDAADSVQQVHVSKLAEYLDSESTTGVFAEHTTVEHTTGTVDVGVAADKHQAHTKPKLSAESSTSDARISVGKARLRRCNAKFQALLERVQECA